MAEAEKRQKNRHISTILRICIAALAVYFVFRGEDLGHLAKRLLGTNPLVFAAAVGLFVISQLIFVLRWSLLLMAQQIRISFWAAVKLHFLGLFYNNCLPGSVGGDFLRAWYVTKHTDKKLEAALSVFVDRAIGFGCTIAMASFFYWVVLGAGEAGDFAVSRRVGGSSFFEENRGIFVIVLAIAAIGVGGLCVHKKGRRLLLSAWQLVRDHGLRMIKKIVTAIHLYCRKPLILAAAVLLAVTCQSVAIVSIWLIGRERGVDAHIKYYFAFFPISWVLGALPISIGGVGIVEGGLKVLFGKVSTVLQEDRVLPGLIQRAVWLASSLPGLFIHVKGAHLPKEKVDFFVDSEQSLD